MEAVSSTADSGSDSDLALVQADSHTVVAAHVPLLRSGSFSSAGSADAVA